MDQLTAISIDRHEEEDDYPSFRVTIPDPLSCTPKRGRFIGGRNHDHPSHSSLIVDHSPSRGIAARDRTCAFTVESHEPSCAVTFGSQHATFAGLSRKTGEMVSGRGPHELAAWRLFEVDPGKIDFVLQGSRVTARSGDESHTHLADYIAVEADGRIVAGEIKANATHFAPAEYHAWMEGVANGYASYGIEFRRDTGDSLRGDARRESNVIRAFGDRFTHVPTNAREAVAETLEAASGPVTLAEIEAILDNEPLLARAKAHALLCERRISFPLSARLHRGTPVALPKHPKSIPDIRSIRSEVDDF